MRAVLNPQARTMDAAVPTSRPNLEFASLKGADLRASCVGDWQRDLTGAIVIDTDFLGADLTSPAR